MPSIAEIRAQVERQIPGALSVFKRSAPEVFPTGIAALDRELGGIPKGALTQICSPAEITSGRTSMLVSLLAQVTGKEQVCAVVDATDCFDPESAEANGVCLSRLLWVRCSGSRMKAVEQAFKAADLLIQNGGFGIIAIDLGDVDEKLIRKIPLTTWFRFARVMEPLPTALVMLLPCPAAQNCAALTLNVSASAQWSGPGTLPHNRLLAKVECKVEVVRTRTRKAVQGTRNNSTEISQGT
ncbi:MAG: DNA recombination/repair protein RecA [Acidobacteriia bacterium]|nr:DNA recombination/repair protein RecA [Terriglobia bacterium]